MHKPLITKLLLLAFFFFSLFLHFYHIDSSPKSVLIDEAALGYNAYTIAQTGKDEFGASLPLLFTSFGDQKLPLYIYTSVIPVKVFGLGIFSIRCMAAVAAAAMVLVMYILLKELHVDEKGSVLGAGITAVAPWTTILGRFSWESSLALLIFSITLIFLVRSLKKDSPISFVLGGLFLGLTWYTYIPYRLIAIFLFVLFLIISRAHIKRKILFIAIFLALIAPSLPALLHSTGSARFKQTTILYNTGNALTVNDERLFCNENGQQTLCSLVLNKPIEIAYSAVKTFVRTLSVTYLFISGAADGQLINVGKFALLPFFLAPLYLLGFIQIYLKQKELRKQRHLIFLAFAFLACFIPFVITKSPVRIQMSALFPFMVSILIFGYTLLAAKIKNNTWIYLLYGLLFVYGFIFLFYFVNVHARKNYANEKFLASAAVYLGQRYTTNDVIYIDPVYADFLILYAFYNHVDPTFYQKHIQVGRPDGSGFIHTTALGKVKVFHIDIAKEACRAQQAHATGLFLTNHNLAQEIGTKLQPVFDGQTQDHLPLGYIYKLSDIAANENCASILAQM